MKKIYLITHHDWLDEWSTPVRAFASEGKAEEWKETLQGSSDQELREDYGDKWDTLDEDMKRGDYYTVSELEFFE